MARKRDHELDAMYADLLAEGDPMFVADAKPHAVRVDKVEKGFIDILDFHARHGRAPDATADSQYEVSLADRLDVYRNSAQWREKLGPLDAPGLLGEIEPVRDPASMTLAELVADDPMFTDDTGMFDLKHVRSAIERRQADATAPDFVAQREPCPDFDRFRDLIRGIVHDLHTGLRSARLSNGTQKVAKGDAYIVNGQVAYVAEVGEWFQQAHGNTNARIRVVFDNATEARYLARSFAKTVLEDPLGRVIQRGDAAKGGLFDQEPDKPQGYVYAASTQSTDPALTDYAALMLKIGSTVNEPAKRLHGCQVDPTFLMASARIEAEWQVYAMPARLAEQALHAFFWAANVAIAMPDRFGRQVDAREWFLVDLSQVREAVKLISEKRLHHFHYDGEQCRIVSK